MPVHRRKKAAKMRGSKTHGWGAMKKHRGAGNRGGRGMAGTGKRADTKKPTIINLYGNDYFGKRGFRRPQKVVKLQKRQQKMLNLEQLEKFDKQDINLTKLGYTKLLGKGKITKKYTITISSISKKAKEKIEKLGGIINSA